MYHFVCLFVCLSSICVCVCLCATVQISYFLHHMLANPDIMITNLNIVRIF